MAIRQLTDEQIHTWTLDEKDRWWLENVYRGNMAQLTFRSALTGFFLGGLLSATNLYIGAKTGWSLGVGITSVILAFALWKFVQHLGWCSEFTILENNAMQSIATSAGYMTAPLISSLTAYMIVDNRLLPWHQIMIWNIVLSILGVLFAFPMKRRFINDEQHPFPEGRAAGVVMDTLHHADAAVGIVKARIMIWSAGLAGLVKFIQGEAIQRWLQMQFFSLVSRLPLGDVSSRAGRRAAELAADGSPLHLPEQISVILERLGFPPPRIGGIDVRQLTVDPSLDLALMGAGGLMGIRVGVSLIVGAVLNYCVLAPWMIRLEEIQPTPAGTFGLRQITLWSLWPGVTCMVIASFVAFFSKPRLIVDSVRGLFGQRNGRDVLRQIEFPLWISIVGIPLFSLLAAWLARLYFGVSMWACLVGIPLTFVLCLVAANSTALTSITPVGATSKITQLFYGVIQPQNIHTNLATAGLTAEVVSNSSNLLMDIKPGYMLGAKPRQQAIGHVIGIFSGAIASVPLFYLLFTRNVAQEGLASIQSEKFPMPSVTVWKAVAEVLTEGFSKLPRSVLYAMAAAALIGLVLDVARIVTRGRFPLSAIGLGLAFVIDFGSSFTMFLGAAFFWMMGVGRHDHESGKGNVWVENHEPICAGIIAGAALVGILDAVVQAFLL